MTRSEFRRAGTFASVVGFVFAGSFGVALAAESDVWGDGEQACVPAVSANCAGVSHKWEAEHHGDLSGINLKRAKLHGADLRDADMSDANLNRVVLRHASLDGADLTGSTLKRAKLHHASMNGVDADGANFLSAGLTHVQVMGASMRGADFRDARFDRVDIANTDFSSVEPVAGMFARADVYDKSNMQGSQWKNARVRDSDFSGANMTGSYFKDSTFWGANFTNANLSNSTFDGDSFFLSGTNFSGADLSNSTISQDTFTHMKGSVGGINLSAIRLTGDNRDYSSTRAPIVYRVKNRTSASNIVINLSNIADGDRRTGDYGFGPGQDGYFWVTSGDANYTDQALSGWVDGLAIDTFYGGVIENNSLTWNNQKVTFNSGSLDTAGAQFTSGSRSYKIDVQYLAAEKRYRVDLTVGDA